MTFPIHHSILVGVAGIVVLERLAGVFSAILVGVAGVCVNERLALVRLDDAVLIVVAGVGILKHLGWRDIARTGWVLNSILVEVAGVVVADQNLGVDPEGGAEDRGGKV